MAGFEQKAEELRKEPPRPLPKRVIKPPRKYILLLKHYY